VSNKTPLSSPYKRADVKMLHTVIFFYAKHIKRDSGGILNPIKSEVIIDGIDDVHELHFKQILYRLFPIKRTTLLLITLAAFSISFRVKAVVTAMRMLGLLSGPVSSILGLILGNLL